MNCYLWHQTAIESVSDQSQTGHYGSSTVRQLGSGIKLSKKSIRLVKGVLDLLPKFLNQIRYKRILLSILGN